MNDAGASVSASRAGSMTPAYCLPCFVIVFLLPRLFGWFGFIYQATSVLKTFIKSSLPLVSFLHAALCHLPKP
jgi:hypothetical protein